ncbi:MAG: GNAT family N-acyltransferase [Stagnimonas sp.]|nr:GNAT family N-acyltransferase [Stagnimonas sp.]
MSIHPTTTLSLPRPRGWGWAATTAEQLTGLAALQQLYEELPENLEPAAFVRAALQRLGVQADLASGCLDAVPATGPVVLVCNHPCGAADGLVLADLLLARRPDLLLLANHLLRRLPQLAPLIAPVDVFRSGASLGGVRAALRHLDDGGALLLFPAGEVSRLDWRQRRVTDRPWAESAALLARRTGAAVVPLHIEGQARWPSLVAGAVHPRLRTLCLARDLLQQRNSRVAVHLGDAIPAAELGRIAPPSQTAYLRLLSESLVQRPSSTASLATTPVPVAEAESADALAQELAALPAECRLVQQTDFTVVLADAARIPATLREIGRLRELSFRAVQEGTGTARDLDAFDADYQHLYVWHHPTRQLVGAYRLGFTQTLSARRGVEALYTRTLFRYDRALLQHLGPSIELGRSFVVPAWQRNFRALRLLWSGIAAVLDARPEIRCLFGPVSISATYSPLARALMETALNMHHGDAHLQTLVSPRTPSRDRAVRTDTRPLIAALSDPALLSRVVARLDRGSGLPVLLRHYLDLKGRFAGFNVDADFGDTLDGLVFVRVADIPAPVRAKFSLATVPR